MIHTLIGRLTGWERRYREALAQRDENKAMATGYLKRKRRESERVGELTSLLDIRDAHQREAVDLITRAQQQMGLNDSGIPTARKYLADAKNLLGGDTNGAR